MSKQIDVVVAYFDYGQQNKYAKLAEVCKYSINKNFPNANLIFKNIPVPKNPIYKHHNIFVGSNTDKLACWRDHVLHTDNYVALLDCDTLVLRDFSEVFYHEFDIGITMRRNGAGIPMNGGVVFVQPTDKAKEYMEEWYAVNCAMVLNKEFLQKYRRIFAGLNQAAAGAVLSSSHPYTIKEFPCAVYNMCDDPWDDPIDEAAIVHFKSGLRQAVFSRTVRANVRVGSTHPLVKLWHEYFKEVQEMEPQWI